MDVRVCSNPSNFTWTAGGYALGYHLFVGHDATKALDIDYTPCGALPTGRIRWTSGVDTSAIDAADVNARDGNYTRAETDLTSPGSGLPLQITRTYLTVAGGRITKISTAAAGSTAPNILTRTCTYLGNQFQQVRGEELRR
jgi:hypothetical protein